MLVREGLDSINSLQGSVGFDYFDAFRNYQVAGASQHGQQLAAIAADIAPVNPSLAAILGQSPPAAEPAPGSAGCSRIRAYALAHRFPDSHRHRRAGCPDP